MAAFGDWRIPLYSWIVIFITGKVINANEILGQGFKSLGEKVTD